MTYRGTVEILTTCEDSRWQEALEQIGIYDFYHLASFHRLAELRGEGDAAMFVFRKSGYTLAFPLLTREINLTWVAGNVATDRRDATSVFGFAGPLASSGSLPEDVRIAFLDALQEYLEQQRMVSVFSRLNPLINQPPLLAGYGQVIERGVTLAIDLTPPLDVQYARYRRSHKRDIRKLEAMGFVSYEAGKEGLDDFVRIYGRSMERVGAQEAYLFDRSYFDYLMTEMSDVMRLFVCELDGRIASVAICAVSNGIIQGHLGGTDDDFLECAPSKLIYDNWRRWGTSIGARILHLGGGVAAQRDQLYNFKLGFGCHECIYSTWRHIVNQEAYDELCQEAWRSSPVKRDDSFFPAYRNSVANDEQEERKTENCSYAGTEKKDSQW